MDYINLFHTQLIRQVRMASQSLYNVITDVHLFSYRNEMQSFPSGKEDFEKTSPVAHLAKLFFTHPFHLPKKIRHDLFVREQRYYFAKVILEGLKSVAPAMAWGCDLGF
jgi:hypothetical protein